MMNQMIATRGQMDRRRRNRVEFNVEPTVHEIPNLASISEDEKANVWLTSDDLRRMRNADLPIIRKLKVGRDFPSEARGLKSPVASMERRIAAMDGIAAVLGEQSRQQNSGKIDEEMIRTCYIRATSEFIKEAITMGAKDAEEAQSERQPSPTRRGLRKSTVTHIAANTKVATPHGILMRTNSTKPFNTRRLFQHFLVRSTAKVNERNSWS